LLQPEFTKCLLPQTNPQLLP